MIVDLRECEPGDVLICSTGAILEYVRPCTEKEYLDHRIQYIRMPEGEEPKNCYGTRTHDGHVYAKNRMFCDHDVVRIIKKNSPKATAP